MMRIQSDGISEQIDIQYARAHKFRCQDSRFVSFMISTSS